MNCKPVRDDNIPLCRQASQPACEWTSNEALLILSFSFLRLGFGVWREFTLGMGIKESIIEAYNIIGAQSGWLAAYNCM
jgi:hypothetical protein